MSDRCHIRKFEEVHKQISKFVIKFKTLRDKIVLNRKKKINGFQKLPLKLSLGWTFIISCWYFKFIF